MDKPRGASSNGSEKALTGIAAPGRQRAGYSYVASSAATAGLSGAKRAVKGLLKPNVKTVPASMANGSVHQIFPSERFDLQRPSNFSNSDWAAFQLRNVNTIPSSLVFDAPNATVVGSEGWVRDSDGNFIGDIWSEVGFPASGMILKELVHAQPSRHLNGISAVLTMPWMPNYYHWTLQVVPRVHLLSKIIDIQSINYWIVPPKATRFQNEWLKTLRIAEDKCVPASGAISCDRLLAASIPAPNRWIPGWVAEYVRSQMLTASQEPKRRIYITRDEDEKRRILNQGAVSSALFEAGLETISMSGLSVHQQAELFASASLIVSVLGAALTNLVYCAPVTTLIELVPKNLTFPAYAKLAKTVGLDYHGLVGLEPRVPQPFYKTDPSADMIADVAALRRLLHP